MKIDLSSQTNVWKVDTVQHDKHVTTQLSEQAHGLRIGFFNTPMKILLIEDNRDLATNMFDYFEVRGHT